MQFTSAYFSRFNALTIEGEECHEKYEQTIRVSKEEPALHSWSQFSSLRSANYCLNGSLFCHLTLINGHYICTSRASSVALRAAAHLIRFSLWNRVLWLAFHHLISIRTKSSRILFHSSLAVVNSVSRFEVRSQWVLWVESRAKSLLSLSSCWHRFPESFFWPLCP